LNTLETVTTCSGHADRLARARIAAAHPTRNSLISSEAPTQSSTGALQLLHRPPTGAISRCCIRALACWKFIALSGSTRLASHGGDWPWEWLIAWALHRTVQRL